MIIKARVRRLRTETKYGRWLRGDSKYTIALMCVTNNRTKTITHAPCNHIAVAHVQLFQQSEAHLYKFHNHVIVAPVALAPTIITVAHTLAPQHPPPSSYNGWTLKQVVTAAQAQSRGDGQTSTIIGGHS